MPKPTPTHHVLLEKDKHLLVMQDGQPREARYQTTYDDGTKEETIHQLYLEEGEVRSVPLELWPAEQQALAQRDAARAKRAGMQHGLQAAAAAHKGKAVSTLTLPEMRDLVALLLDRAGLLDDDGRIA